MTNNYYDDGIPVRGESTEPSGGIYSLTGVGNTLSKARRFYDEMVPQDTDSTGVRGGKEVLRWGTVAVCAAGGALGGGAVGAMVAL
jgi:hypothetical protein